MRSLIAVLFLCSLSHGATWIIDGVGGSCPTSGFTPGATYHCTTLALAYTSLTDKYGSGARTLTETETIQGDTTTPQGAFSVFPMVPTASFHIIFTANAGLIPAGGCTAGGCPVIDCGGGATSVALAANSPGYLEVHNWELRNCGQAVTGAAMAGIVVQQTYIHDLTATSNLYSIVTGSGGTFDHVWITNAKGGISGNGAFTYIKCYGMTGVSCISPPSGATSTYSNVLCANGTNTNATSCILAVAGDVAGTTPLTGNIGYASKYGMQSMVNTGISPIFAYDLSINNVFNCHGEGGAAALEMNRAHELCYFAGTGAEIRQNATSGTATSQACGELSITNGTNNGLDANVFQSDPGMFANAAIDYNNYWNVGTSVNVSKIGSPSTQYATLALWQAALNGGASPGPDLHSQFADPRFVGNISMLNTTSDVCNNGESIESCINRIRKNFIPTNLALKGKGASSNGTVCVADGSDPGPIPITVFASPGANMSSSVANSFSGGVAF